MSSIRMQFPLAAALAALAMIATPGAAHDRHDPQHRAESAPGYARQLANYRLPQVALQRIDGAAVRFPQELDDGRPVMLNFIYTTCTAICPILSQTFAEVQRRLGPESARVHMVSITIDPEEDTAQEMAAYAKRLAAGKQWGFYTGTLDASVTMQKAFQAYFGDKMHHRPVTFLRAAPGQPWVRLDGFASPDEVLAEYHQLIAQQQH